MCCAHKEFFMNTKKSLGVLYGLGVLLSVVLIWLDQFTKYLAVEGLRGKRPFVILPGVFELRYLENQGAAFGVLQGKRTFFLVVTLLMILLLIYVYGRIPLRKRFFALHGICIALFAGAVGNCIDRAANDYVIDFFYFSLINFPIFNVADIYVTCAMAVFVVLFLFYYREEELDLLAAEIFPWKKREASGS